MFKPALVYKFGRCRGTNRSVAAGLFRPPTQLPGKSDPSRVREKFIPGSPGMNLPWVSNIPTGARSILGIWLQGKFILTFA